MAASSRLARFGAVVLTLVTSLLVMPPKAQSADIEVDVELVLAVDVSRSMSPRELEIQRRGYAEALTSREVVSAITGGLLGRVAVQYVEWAGSRSQRIIVDWTLIRGLAEAQSFAARLTAHFDSSMRRTSISGALQFAARQFDGNGFQSYRRIIDISGDGPNNHGRPVLAARGETLARGIVINGLPLMTREGLGSQFYLKDLDEYYRHCVIGGPGAFFLPVLDWQQFPVAVRHKLVMELATPQAPPAIMPIYIRNVEDSYDCMIGEKIWEDFMDDWISP
ncbi:MAG: DUF1194 domain-containing protein [Alphaproteobacteria bacterium]|nr:DUF1194 domain-containing protein [Alphaproteobacteria bacterium]